MKANNPAHSETSLKSQKNHLENRPQSVPYSNLAYFLEKEPIEKRKDPVTGREIKQGCLPFNRKIIDWEEMDNYFVEG